MPKELPSAAELWEGEISFFSIDTDLIQSAGYNFSAGALNQLPSQLPRTMELQFTEVVAQEIISHQMVPVVAAINQFRSASGALKRTASIEMANIDASFDALLAEDNAAAHFRQKITAYSERCGGGILPIQGRDLAEKIFNRYFSGGAPFGLRADKKSEFPDAASLIILETYAQENNTKGIIASRDKGASDFADKSEFIYCVKSIEDLATLFSATDEHARIIKARVLQAILDEDSPLRLYLQDSISEHVSNAKWSVDEIYSGTVSRVEGQVYEAELQDYEIDTKQAEIWESKDEPGVWIVELGSRANTTVSTDVTYFVWDSIDKEEVEIARQPVYTETTIKFKSFLRCSGVTEANEIEAWDVEIDIASGSYQVDVGEVEPDFGDEGYEE